MLWMMRLLQQQLCLRVLRPRTGLREADLQQHHSFDPQVDAVVDRSWVRTARVWRPVRSGALVRAGVQLGCTAAEPFLPRALLWFCPLCFGSARVLLTNDKPPDDYGLQSLFHIIVKMPA